MITLSETRPPEENFIQTISLIAILTILVFFSDITTPLGLMVWILYFIPLFLTLYIRWQYGPFVVAGTAIILIGISYLLSPRDMSEFFALVNRIFFSLMLVVSALLIWKHKKRELLLEVSERRYQNMIESSPETILITRGGVIQYINLAGLELCDVTNGAKTGSEWMSMFDPEDQDLIALNIEKATQGARIELPGIRIKTTMGRTHLADVWIGEILWDGTPAIEMIIRSKNG